VFVAELWLDRIDRPHSIVRFEMPQTQHRCLIVGKLPEALSSRFLPEQETKPQRCAHVPQNGKFDRVVAEARFDYFDFLRFGEELVQLRDCVAPGGELILIRKRGTTDRFFVYRDDDFFAHEFPAAWQADFQEVMCGGDSQALWIHAKGRRLPEDAEQLRAALPWGHLAHLFTFASQGLKPPNYIWVPATFRCNLRCRTCSVRNSPPGKDVSPELIDQIFDAVGAAAEVVNVTGIGEPFFSRSWPHLRRRIRERPYRRLEIVTNGMLLTEDEVRDMMRPEHPTILIVSIDGARKETFEYIRDRARWERLVATMEMIARLRRELQPGPGFSLGVDFVAVRDNIRELPELIPKLAEWGVDLVLVIEMGDWEVNRDFFAEQALRFYPRLANEYYDKARAIASQYPFRLVSIPPNYTEDAIAALERASTPAPQQPVWRRAARRIFHGLSAAPWGRAVCRLGLGLLEWYCAHPWGMPRRVGDWLRQQVAMSRLDGFGEFARVRGFCEVIAERAYFHIDGEVGSCCGLMKPTFGNFQREGFEAVWHGALWRELRLRNLLGFPHSACYYCTLPYALPSKNPENFMAAHQLRPGENWLAQALRRWRHRLQQNGAGGTK
jgi:MoaA/NifB/PqqE/SkfB family radical SAM enzyme